MLLMEQEVNIVNTVKRSRQVDDSIVPRHIQIEYLWREILLVAPETAPLEFAISMQRCGFLTAAEIASYASWADHIRQFILLLHAQQMIDGLRQPPGAA